VSEDQRLSATSNSGLSVLFRTTTPSICTIQSGALAPVAAGNCVVVASQAGDGTYSPAEEVSRTVVITFVAKSPQRITISPVSAMILEDSPQQLSISTITETALQLTASPSNVCTIDLQRRVMAIGEGICNVRALQPSTRQLEEAEAKVSLTVFRRASIAERVVALEWPRPTSIDARTPLGQEQLNAKASIPGKYSYSPSAGTLLSSGINDLTVTFTPDDLANYVPVTMSVKILVRRAEAPTASPSPSPSPTVSPTASPSASPTTSPTTSPTSSPRPSLSPTPTMSPTPRPSRSVSASPTPTSSPSPIQSVSPTAIPVPSISAGTNAKGSGVQVKVENVKPGSRVKVTVRKNVKP
jgi:hypothetical protein